MTPPPVFTSRKRVDRNPSGFLIPHVIPAGFLKGRKGNLYLAVMGVSV
jgi:hypothetical protein